MTSRDIISDNMIEAIHRGNFGSMSPRRVVDEAVLKMALGYSSGSTVIAILRDHGLTMSGARAGTEVLSPLGMNYLRAIFASRISLVLDYLEGR